MVAKGLTRSANSFSPLNRIVYGILVALCALLVTVFVPGFIAKRHGVFFDEDVRSKLPKAASQSLGQYENERKRLNGELDGVKKRFNGLDSVGQERDVDLYTHLLAQREKEVGAIKPPIYTIGFFLSPQMLLWPAIYTSLGCLLICFESPRLERMKRKHVLVLLGLGSLIYVYYEWPLWARNFLLGSHGRTVFAFTNYDIDKASFLTQEGMIAGFAFLLAAVWMKWSYIAEEQQETLKRESGKGYFNPALLSRVQSVFSLWILSSLVLALGFAYFTTFFWNLVAGYHDQRYILSAFLAHSLWILTWSVLSMPLLRCWSLLRAERLHAVEVLMKAKSSTPGSAEQMSVETLEKLESIAGIRISLAGAGALISLVLPIVQLFVHKS